MTDQLQSPTAPALDWLHTQFPEYAGADPTDLARAFRDKYYPGADPVDFQRALTERGQQYWKEKTASEVKALPTVVPKVASAVASRLAQTPEFLNEVGPKVMGLVTGQDPNALVDMYKADPNVFKQKLADTALDFGTAAFGPIISESMKAAGVGMEMGGGLRALAGKGLTNAITRSSIEAGGINAIYDSVDSAVTGQSMKDVVSHAWRGAKMGAAIGAGLPIVAGAVNEVLGAMAGRAATEATAASRGAASAVDAADKADILRAALEDSGIRSEPPGPRATAGDNPDAPHPLEGPSAPPRGPLSGNGFPISSEAGYSTSPEQYQSFPPIIRHLEDMRAGARRAIAGRFGPGPFGSPYEPQSTGWVMTPAASRPPGAPAPSPIAGLLPAPTPALLGPGPELGTSYPTTIPSSGTPIPLEAQGIARLRVTFPGEKWGLQPVGIRSSAAANAFPIGAQVYDVAGRPLDVIAHSETGRLGVQSLHPNDGGRFGNVGVADVTLGQPSPFVTMLNRIELGARTRAALRAEPSGLRASSGIDLAAKAAGASADEVAIGLGKLGRVYEFAKSNGWTPSQSFQEWSRSMIAEFGQEVSPRLAPIYKETNRRYGDAIQTLLTREPGMEETLYDAVARLRRQGFTGKDWYNVRDGLTGLLGEERANKLIPLLAIFSPRNSIEGNVTKALQGLAQYETGTPTGGWLPAHQMNFDRWLAEEDRISGQKANSFGANLAGDVNRVTLDMWMKYFLAGNKAFQSEAKTFTARQYDVGEAIVKDFAKEHGLNPSQMQASMWTDEVVQREILGKMIDNGVAKPSADVSSLRPFDQVLAKQLSTRGDYMPEARAIKQTLDPNAGGGTWYHGNYSKPMDQPGFVVALTAPKFARAGLDAATVRPKMLADVPSDAAGLVKTFGRKFLFTSGTWHDPATGKVWPETGVLVPTLEDALRLGRLAKQQSVAELGPAGQFITTHDTGLPGAGTLTAGEARKVLTEYLKGKELPHAGD